MPKQWEQKIEEDIEEIKKGLAKLVKPEPTEKDLMTLEDIVKSDKFKDGVISCKDGICEIIDKRLEELGFLEDEEDEEDEEEED